ncbi:RNA polymerase sigma-70 factor, ECF subfamily [Pleomorphomonas diazotrophica]|nr:RNA polymerase sigma-70 factor, ECF subfamily [Pleomorphomonas diazotrophica]
MQADTDESLLKRISAGDQRALRLLMDRHMARAIRLAERVLRDSAAADDVAQEAFVRVWKHASRFDEDRAQFTTWLYRIVMNLALDRARRPGHAPLDDALDVADSAPDGEETLVRRERVRLLGSGLAALPERQRAALTLFHLEGLTGREGAAAMNVSEKSFESLLGRGRAALKAWVSASTKGRTP